MLLYWLFILAFDLRDSLGGPDDASYSPGGPGTTAAGEPYVPMEASLGTARFSAERPRTAAGAGGAAAPPVDLRFRAAAAAGASERR